jgi:acetyl esterase
MDPELEAFIHLFPPADLSDPPTARKNLAALAASVPALDTGDMKIEDRSVPVDPPVAVRIYRPHGAEGAIVWLHGGGFVMGDLDTEHPAASRLADGSGVVVVSVGYRRAPEHRFPAALDDAYAALAWTAEHAVEFGIDPARIGSEVTVPAEGSRPRWRCGSATSRGRRSASSCSTSPSWTTARRRGRSGTSPIYPG